MQIVIVTNRNDFYLCKLLVASIRFFYADIKISLLKEYTNGQFNTKEMEDRFNVDIINLGVEKYGWGIAKIHAIISDYFKPGTKILLLDADIVFIGRVLDKILSSPLINNDIIIHPDIVEDCKSDFVKNTYFDIDNIKKIEPNYIFPGYTFNTGQIVITAGKFKREDFFKYLDFSKHPYWNVKYKNNFPFADQSLLNIIVHNKEAREEVTVGKLYFNKYPDWHEYKDIKLKDFLSNNQPFLMHWAGCKRLSALEFMSHSDILFYLKKQYYKRLPGGVIRYQFDNFFQTLKYNFIFLARKLKNKIYK